MSERKPKITRVRGRKTVERPPPSIGEYEVVDSWPPLSPVPQLIERQPIRRSDGYHARAPYVVIAIIVVALIWLGVILVISGLLPIHMHTVTITPTTIAIHPTFTLPKATITTTIISTKTSTITSTKVTTTTITKTETILMTPSRSVNLQVADALTDLIRKTPQGDVENWRMDSVKYLLSGFLHDGELDEFELKSLNETLHQHLNLTVDNNLIALIMALQSAYSDGNLNEEIDDICKLANHALDINEEDCKSVLSQAGGSSGS